MKKNIIPISIVFILIILLFTYITYSNFFIQKFEYAATIEATRIDLPSRVSTVVKTMAVEEGQTVKKGEILTVLSCDDLLIIQSLAKENYSRAVNLKRTGSISNEAYDLAQNRKQDSDTRLNWCKIKAPIDGTILTKFLEPEEWVNPGTKILTIADLDNLWAYFYVSQDVMAKLKLMDSVVGNVLELNKSFPGTIIKINDEAEFTPKNVQTQIERTRLVFGIKVAFKNPNRILKPGMTIQSSLMVK